MTEDTPLEFISVHRGTSWVSIIRIPLGLFIAIALFVLFVFIAGTLIPEMRSSEVVVLGSFFGSLLVTSWIFKRILPITPTERIRFLPGELEWTFDPNGKNDVYTFSAEGGTIQDSRFDYIDIVSAKGEKLILHKNWIPQFPTPNLNVSFCELLLHEGRFAMQGIEQSRHNVSKVTKLYV